MEYWIVVIHQLTPMFSPPTSRPPRIESELERSEMVLEAVQGVHEICK
jgi:hypothetical protein